MSWLPAAPALATQRWVAPSPQGKGDCTTQANAGTIEQGFGTCGGVAAKEGDEIIITPGAYSVTKTLMAPTSGSVHGLAGSPRPTIEEASSAEPVPITLDGPGAQVSYLAIQNDLANGRALEGIGLAENVIATATGTDGSAILSTSLVRDSIAKTTGTGGIALNGGSAGFMRAQNVTAFSTGPGSYGIQATAFAFEEVLMMRCESLGAAQVTAENVIAHGTLYDVATIPPLCAASVLASIGLDYSNFHTTSAGPPGTIRDNGHNQESLAQTDPAAIFLAPASSPPDFRELPTAPTIDAGIANMLGPTDPDGNPRTLGAAPDIGAFEFVPPITPAGGGTGAKGGGIAAPSIESAAQSAAIWREGNGLAQFARKRTPPIGTTFTFKLNEPATARFDFTQRIGGRRVGRKCVAQAKRNRNKRRCARTVIAGTLSFTAHAGTNKVRFQGRLSATRRLKRGRYTLIITAVNSASARSAPVSLSFTIVR
jgi:hypothetical protein